jgi:cell division protein FtsN
MARDYKSRVPAYRQEKQRPTRFWTAAGLGATLMSGLLVGGFYFLAGSDMPGAGAPNQTPASAQHRDRPSSTRGAATEGPTKPIASQPENSAVGKPEAPKVRLGLFKIMSEREAILPENEIKILKREENRGRGRKTAFLVQAGSFKAREDAERLKTRLSGLKLNAKLELIQTERAAWHRVKIGPFGKISDADKVRQYLKTHEIDSVIQTAK